MAEKNKSLTRKLVHAGGWRLARRVARSIPYVGTAVAIGLVGHDIKRKGLKNGLLNAGLDAIPFVGAAKNAVEFFSGDFLPDKNSNSAGKTKNNGG